MVHKLRGFSAPLLALAVVALLGLGAAPRPAAAAGVVVVNTTFESNNPLGGPPVFIPTTVYVYPDGSAYAVGSTHVPNPTHMSAVVTGETGETSNFYDPVHNRVLHSSDVEVWVTSDGTLTFYAVFYP